MKLNETGLSQARLIGRRLAGIDYLDRIVASPLQRARVTAEIIAEETGLPLEINPGLQEMNFGLAEGEPFHEVGARFPDISNRILDPSDLDARYPQGESRREFFGRVERTVNDIATAHQGEDVVVVAHGGFISAMLTVLLKDSPNNWRDHPIRNCSLTHVEFATDGLTAHMVNDAVHLDEEIDLLADSVGDET